MQIRLCQLIKHCLLQIEEVAYVDKGRNLAVALGERDVKVTKNFRHIFSDVGFNFVLISHETFLQADVKAKNKRERKVLMIISNTRIITMIIMVIITIISVIIVIVIIIIAIIMMIIKIKVRKCHGRWI